MPIIENETYTKLSAEELKHLGNEFENCTFRNCELKNSHLSGIVFMDCRFIACNLAGCYLQNSGLQNISFKDCNLSAIDFGKARDFLFEVRFEDCSLDNTVFYRKKLKGTKFINCSCKEIDFTDTDLANALFDNCNLHRTAFNNTILSNADFTSSFNYTIDPDNNTFKKTKFSVHGLPGLLAKYDIVIK